MLCAIRLIAVLLQGKNYLNKLGPNTKKKKKAKNYLKKLGIDHFQNYCKIAHETNQIKHKKTRVAR